jgi:hypothetical protein
MLEARLSAVGADDLEELGITGPPPPPPEDPTERFWQWMEAEPTGASASGLPMLVEHVRSFWERRDEPNVQLFHYADLRADLAGQMTRLAGALGVDPPGSELVEAATFERMKASADDLAPNSDISLWQDNTHFFDRARSGDWHEHMGAGGDERYERALLALAPADLADWLHNGWLGTSTSTT